jgi:hypothetical protein
MRHFTVTIGQLMKLVVFAAAACACVVSGLEFYSSPVIGPLGMLAFELIAIPIVWAMLALLMVKERAWKDASVVALVLTSLSVVLSLLIWALITDFIPSYMRPQAGVRRRVELTAVVGISTTILLLSSLFGFLLAALIRIVRRLSKSNRETPFG